MDGGSSGGGSKWMATVASVWIQSSCGASYAFGIYSPILKSSQGYDQSTLDAVSVFKDVGANVGVLSGVLYFAVASPDRRGRSRPWIVHAAGAAQCFAGYFLMWLSVTGVISRPPVPAMCLFMFMAAHAQTFFNTANVVVAVENFPGYGGTIVGIMKGFLGLSGAILIQLYQTLFKGNPTTFLLMVAFLPTLVSLLLMFFVKVCEASPGSEKKCLDDLSSIALSVATYLMIVIVLENVLPFPLWARILTCSVLLLLLSSPLKIAITALREEPLMSSRTESVSRTPLINSAGSAEPEKILDATERACPEDDVSEMEEEMNLLEAAQTLKFWLLFLSMVCGMGSGLATINNISQIGESLSYRTTEINTLVSLWSIWNFLGRFGAGYVSDVFLHRHGWGRPLFISLTLAAMTVGHIIIASGFPGNLYAGSVIVGICYGSQWSLMPTIASEIFGVRHMGTIFNAIAAANPVGSYLLSVQVVGKIYDREASRKGEGSFCYGTHCFMLSFFIFASVSLLGFFTSFVLFCRTRRFYRTVRRRSFRHSSG